MNEEELKRLIEKYYSGLSTDEDEKALRAYFINNTAPQGYEAEREIFSFYSEAGDVPEPSADFESRIIKALDATSGSDKPAKFRKLLVPLFSAAAGLLILAGSYFFFIHSAEPKDTYSNPEIAYAETMKILMNVSTRMNHCTRALKPVGRINEMKVKSFGSINKSATLVEKNLRSLSYLRNSDETDSASKEKTNN
jgi:hypothetical protein